MNKPYVKEYGLDEKGERVLLNPIPPSGYLNYFPNRQQRRSSMRGPKRFNCRKGRNYYQVKMKPVYDQKPDDAGEMQPFILYSIPTNSTICHRKDGLVSSMIGKV